MNAPMKERLFFKTLKMPATIEDMRTVCLNALETILIHQALLRELKAHRPGSFRALSAEKLIHKLIELEKDWGIEDEPNTKKNKIAWVKKN